VTFTKQDSILIAATLGIMLSVPLLVPALYGSSTITLSDHPAIVRGICLSGTRLVAIMVTLDRADQAWIVACPPGSPFDSGTFGIWR
jgi:hypothetical protein